MPLHKAVVCRRCWERDWSSRCFACGEKWQIDVPQIGRFCAKCHSLRTPEGERKTLLAEGEQYLAQRSMQKVQITGDEPSLQLLVLPIHSGDSTPHVSSSLPAYSDTADFLSPTHCRLCLWDAVGQASAAGSTDAQPDAHSVAADRFTNDHHKQQGALNTLEVEMEGASPRMQKQVDCRPRSRQLLQVRLRLFLCLPIWLPMCAALMI